MTTAERLAAAREALTAMRRGQRTRMQARALDAIRSWQRRFRKPMPVAALASRLRRTHSRGYQLCRALEELGDVHLHMRPRWSRLGRRYVTVVSIWKGA